MRLLLAALVVVASAAGCDRRDDLDGRRRPIPGLEPTAGPTAGSSLGEKALAFDFIDNRAAALVYVNGALTSSGRGAAFALLSRGGAGGNWRLGSGSRPSARVDGQVGHIFFPFDKDKGGISAGGATVPVSIRFHPAARDQLVSVFLNDTKVADVPMTETGTAEYRFEVPRALIVPGENDLRLFFRYAVSDEGLRTAGALERISIGSASAPTTAPVQARAVERESRRLEALSSASASRLSFHVRVPRTRPQLLLSAAGEKSASVRVTSGAGGGREVWRADLGAAWKSADIDLSDVAGELVRVDLISAGAVDWGRPQLVSDPLDAPSSASSAATPHVIVWIVSGLRRDSLVERGPMPALRALAARGTRFDAVSRSPTESTAALEILGGRRADASALSAQVETLAERFRGAGYKTALYSNAPVLSGDTQGFERVVRSTSLDAATLWKRAQAALKSNSSVRTLTVMWVDEPALPWRPGPERLAPQWRSYTGRVQPGATAALAAQLRAASPPLTTRDRDYVRALYKGELATVDGAIATMVADLDALGVAANTGVLVVGDRGQELFEHEGFGEPTGLGAESRLVPMVVSAPGRAAVRSETMVVTADAFATALDLGQIAVPVGSDGTSVFTSARPERAVLLRLAGRARGIATSGATWVEAGGEAVLFKESAEGSEVAVKPQSDPVTTRALINWMSLLGATERWDARRWGPVTSLRPAFASEQGGL